MSITRNRDWAAVTKFLEKNWKNCRASASTGTRIRWPPATCSTDRRMKQRRKTLESYQSTCKGREFHYSLRESLKLSKENLHDENKSNSWAVLLILSLTRCFAGSQIVQADFGGKS